MLTLYKVMERCSSQEQYVSSRIPLPRKPDAPRIDNHIKAQLIKAAPDVMLDDPALPFWQQLRLASRGTIQARTWQVQRLQGACRAGVGRTVCMSVPLQLQDECKPKRRRSCWGHLPEHSYAGSDGRLCLQTGIPIPVPKQIARKAVNACCKSVAMRTTTGRCCQLW
jgi:hypothetical protein